MADTVSWQETRAKRRPREDAVSRHREHIEAEERAFRLRELRESQGLTQSDLAQRMSVTQPSVSALESGELGRSGLSTLQSYIEALGGQVDIVATFGDRKIVLQSAENSRSREE